MKLLAPIKNDEDIVNKKYVDTAADKLQSQVNNKADKEHNHDNRYYTESEVDSKVSGINKTISDHISNTSNPHGVTKSQVGLGNVGNFKAVSTVANQGLTDTEKTNARANIGAGTSSFSGSYNDLTNKPTIPTVGNGTITITQKGVTKGTFTTNQSGNTTIELTDDNTTYGVATQSSNGLESAADKKKLDGIATGAEVNQNAFSNIIVGSTTISADSKTDSLTLVGSNVTITPDADNDKVTIGITKANVTSALGYTPPTTNTDTKVNVTLGTTTKAYLLGTSTTPTSTATGVTAISDTGVYLDTAAGNLTATQFNGKLNGNATSATKATQDSAGQQINTTYIKDLSISGTSLSYTKGDSTVSTVIVNDLLSGSALRSNGTTATTTKGYSYGVAGVTTSPYNYTKWYAYLDSGITTLTNGMIIKMRIPVAGCNYGTCIAIDGADFHPVVFNTNSVVTTHYGVGVELLLMYDSNGSAKVYSNSATSAAISGVWRVMNNYNSNTTNTAGSTNTTSKIFLVGTTSQTTYAQTYSNSKVYVGKDSCLYSNGTKVSVEGHTHISEEHSFWNGTSSHTFNYVAGRNRAYIIAWMKDDSRTYMGFNLIYAAPTVNTTSSVILTSNGTTGLSYNVTDGNITIGGGTGSCRCAVIWFTV